MAATAARQLDEITVTVPVAGQLLSGYPTEVQPGTYPVLRDRHLQPTDDDLVCIDILPEGEGDDEVDEIPVFISVRDDGTPRTAMFDFGAVLADMADHTSATKG